MAREKLTAVKVRSLGPGKYDDGDGLRLLLCASYELHGHFCKIPPRACLSLLLRTPRATP